MGKRNKRKGRRPQNETTNQDATKTTNSAETSNPDRFRPDSSQPKDASYGLAAGPNPVQPSTDLETTDEATDKLSDDDQFHDGDPPSDSEEEGQMSRVDYLSHMATERNAAFMRQFKLSQQSPYSIDISAIIKAIEDKTDPQDTLTDDETENFRRALQQRMQDSNEIPPDLQDALTSALASLDSTLGTRATPMVQPERTVNSEEPSK